jgi:tetratricopeptide (TPR) repeat protein
VLPRIFCFCLFCLALTARADDCLQAMARFDYARAAELARERLAQAPADTAAWICLARSQYERGDFEAALISLQTTDGLAKSPTEMVLANNWYGVTLRRLGQPNAAELYLRRAVELGQTFSDLGGYATALHNMAGLLDGRGRPQEAVVWYQASLAINPDAAERSASYNNLGLIAMQQGAYAEAEQLIRKAIDLNRQGGHFHHLGKHLMNLGNLLRRQGRLDEAGTLIAEGQTLVAKAGDRYWLGVGHRLQAWLAKARGDMAGAMRELGLAADDYARAGSRIEMEETQLEMAALANP